MVNPGDYHTSRVAVQDKLNTVYVPKLTSLMSWDFKEGNVLDYGCGPGNTGFERFLPFVESTNSQMYSVDISPKMVKFAQETFPSSRIHYKNGHFPDNFPFDGLQFDKVFSIHVFHFVRDIEATLNSIVSVLKPGGQLGFTTCTLRNFGISILCHLMDSSTWGKYMMGCKDHIPVWSEHEESNPEKFYRRIFIDQTGLKEVHFEFINNVVQFETDQFLNMVYSMNPCVDNVPQNLHSELKEEYRRYITSKLGVPLDTPELQFPFEYLCGVLEKPMST